MVEPHLGGLTVAQFLRRHWQKEPLLARAAFPELANFLRRDSLFELAERDDLESRLVLRRGRRWLVREGPISKRALSRIRDKWSLLVYGVNHVLPEAQRLLEQFAFIPYARLDDVMVSYAPPGGGVGPHFDSYDVFLLQGEGERRWRIGPCPDADLVRSAPLRILRRFRPAREWIARPGDLLYLPPRYGHDGVAVTDCITCSIGFRAGSAQELGVRFLEFMQDRLRLEGEYEDPDLRPQRRPAAVGAAMVRKVERMLGAIDWRSDDVASFLGCYLTEPRPLIVFKRPLRALAPGAFRAASGRRGVRLALATRMLFNGNHLFVNGEACRVEGPARRLLSRLADRRALPAPLRADRESAQLLYQWYRAGYIEVGDD